MTPARAMRKTRHSQFGASSFGPVVVVMRIHNMAGCSERGARRAVMTAHLTNLYGLELNARTF